MGDSSRGMEIARQVARNLHEFTLRDFIITFVLDTLCEAIIASPSESLIQLIQEGVVERYSEGLFRYKRVKSCGKIGCIILYTIEHCYWCEVMRETLNEILKGYGYSEEVIREVDVEKEGCDCIKALPTLSICSTTLTGLQDEDTILSGVLGALVRSCFNSVGG